MAEEENKQKKNGWNNQTNEKKKERIANAE